VQKQNGLRPCGHSFRFCVHRKWFAESPVSPDIKAPLGSSRAKNKSPFTDDELNRIIHACDDVKVQWKNETGIGVWTGEDLKDLIWLMVYTGFRISDATFFNIKQLTGEQVFIRATKNGGDCVCVHSRLAARSAIDTSEAVRRPALCHRQV
jgi:integrase